VKLLEEILNPWVYWKMEMLNYLHHQIQIFRPGALEWYLTEPTLDGISEE